MAVVAEESRAVRGAGRSKETKREISGLRIPAPRARA